MEYLNQIIEGNCLEVMKLLPDSSIDLIATDPPYYKVKGNGGENHFEWWDRQWDKPVEFLKWIDQLAEQWQRILKPNGSLYCFASPKMSARVEVLLAERFNVLNNIRWVKEAGWHQKASKEEARQFKEPWESIIFCEHYGAGQILREHRKAAGLSTNELAKLFPSKSGGITGAVRNWELGNNTPTPEQWAVLQSEIATLPDYENLIRPFSVSADVPYTDVWTYPTVNHYPGKHPCEKPLEMMEHIVQASSRSGGVILDCFCGSGNTLVAAKKHDRQFIGIDIDPHWVDVSRGKLGKTQRFIATEERLQWLELQLQVQGKKIKRLEEQQLSLFQGDHISAKLRIS